MAAEKAWRSPGGEQVEVIEEVNGRLQGILGEVNEARPCNADSR